MLSCVAGFLLSSCPCHPHRHVPPNGGSFTICSSDISRPPLRDTLRHSAWLSGWMRTWSWISWQHISLYMSIFPLDSFPPAPADPNSVLLCRDCTCMWFQVSCPMGELHGGKENSINCSRCLVSSVLKRGSYVRCRVFFWVVSTQEQNPPRSYLFIRFPSHFLMCESVAPRAVRLETLFAHIPRWVQRFLFLPFVILANICSAFIVGTEKGPHRKGPALLGEGQRVLHRDRWWEQLSTG